MEIPQYNVNLFFNIYLKNMSINLNNRKSEHENIFDQIQDKQNKIEV